MVTIDKKAGLIYFIATATSLGLAEVLLFAVVIIYVSNLGDGIKYSILLLLYLISALPAFIAIIMNRKRAKGYIQLTYLAVNLIIIFLYLLWGYQRFINA